MVTCVSRVNRGRFILPGLGALALKLGVGTVVGVVAVVVVGELLLPAITTRWSEFGSTRAFCNWLCV
jgi:hypothetical protein